MSISDAVATAVFLLVLGLLLVALACWDRLGRWVRPRAPEVLSRKCRDRLIAEAEHDDQDRLNGRAPTREGSSQSSSRGAAR